MKDHPVLTNSKPYFKEIKPEVNEYLKNLGAPHIDSFNYMLSEGLDDCIKNMLPVQFELASGDRVMLRIEGCSIAAPTVPIGNIGVKNKKVYPLESRMRHSTYTGMINVRLGWSVNGITKPSMEKDLGEIPIMLRSALCNLNGLSPEQLVEHGEHENEWGGYFIIRGHEKLIRMLLMTRRNYPIYIKRSSWKDRGQGFSDIGIFLRCVATDQTSCNNVLHFISNGTAKFMITHRKTLSYIPVVLLMKALTNYTDEVIYKKLIKGYEDDQYYIQCIQNMLREVHQEGCHTQDQIKDYLGAIFRVRFRMHSWATNAEVTDFLLTQTMLIHLDDYVDKFNLIVYMVQKLFQAVQGKCKFEGSDGVMMQEILLGGHLYQKMLKEKLETWLTALKFNILKRDSVTTSLRPADMTTAIKYTGSFDRTFQTFLATGNLVSSSGLGLMQNTGLVIAAENINRMRYMSHFKAVHRGSFFVEMRTTEARQLLPDAWGFICPVHTPDGSPCGLLNHLTVDAKVSPSPNMKIVEKIPLVLSNLGMIPVNSSLADEIVDTFVVMLEGRIIGYIRHSEAGRIVDKLRLLKIAGEKIPEMTEIVLVPNKPGGQYPGLYIFVGPARMMRPVTNLLTKKTEFIGTFEQIYLDICITEEESYPNLTTHMEKSKTSFMSNLANLIPMPDCNQSPRNMYQCQMGKQTMGTPCHNWQLQAQNKMYRLQTPATPLFRPVHHDNMDMDDFAMGTNAIVAVISYTGYDMEDAMIINKSAYERGFAHGSIYKSEFLEMIEDSYFARDPHNPSLESLLDNDGLPHPGTKLKPGSPFYCYFDTNEAVYRLMKYRGSEDCVVDNVKLCGAFRTSQPKLACITYRIQRNPSVGDKFASRAGQKGICSQKWPAEDLPFTESGLIPDIVFNPHGFPSRMTIAMMIESMAGKTGSVNGLVHDATPFKFTEKDTAIDYFGRLLESGGYNYYGTERMYSGVDGREMKADIFFGVVHYQRLRHMVSDKWQVRSTGPIDAITHQPIKGRSKGGGVRFGEMERDALISHGTSFLLQDRLFHCSDKISTIICKNCGTLSGPINKIVRGAGSIRSLSKTPATCRVCKGDSDIDYIEIPYIFKYLVVQLSSVNINVKLNFKSI